MSLTTPTADTRGAFNPLPAPVGAGRPGVFGLVKPLLAADEGVDVSDAVLACDTTAVADAV